MDSYFIGGPLVLYELPPDQQKPDRHVLVVGNDFSFVDSKGTHWFARRGDTTDGASIPNLIKPMIGGSFEQDYLIAAVLHDIYWQQTERPRGEVNRMFREALLTNGVSVLKAYAMWLAVSTYGWMT